MKCCRLASSFLILIALCAVAVQAQSGRRQAKVPPAAPIPTPTPEPTPEPKKAERDSELLFFVGVDRSDTFSGFPQYFYDAVMQGCVERLRAGSSAMVDVTDRDFGRSDAIKKAKAESSTYVILLSLTIDSMSRSYDDIDVNYVVFAPATAKVLTTGRSYQNSNRKGPVSVGRTGRTSEIYRQELLRQAGEDAASRILKALNLTVIRTR
jgi:hypothetical protein